MSTRRSLCLRFSPSVPSLVRPRISYAFRVFAAVYGHEIAPDDSDAGDIRCFYGPASETRESSRLLSIPAIYRPRSFEHATPKLIKHSYAREEFNLFFGIEPQSGHPDWLGEIFEWLSCSDEMRIAERDSIGRIPYEKTLFARYGISPAIPHASLMMAWLEKYVEDGGAGGPLPRAISPLADCNHAVVCTHDIDYYFTNRKNAFVRLVKNQLISILARDPAFFASSASELWRFLRGRRFGDFLPEFLDATAKHRLRATVFLIANPQHRRDGNTRLTEIMPRIHEASRRGFSTGIHGSYESIVENSNLASEIILLEELTGRKPTGGRQHWLRFDSHKKLFHNIADCGLQFDSTLGFVETAGFRNGAAFPFPPYNFAKEQPYPFLEIPLAIMDTGLWHAKLHWGVSPSSLAEEVLNQSRRWGWGGIAVLWHNPLEAVGISTDINRVFWEELNKSPKHHELLTSGDELLSGIMHRYHQAGLLNGEKAVAASAAG